MPQKAAMARAAGSAAGVFHGSNAPKPPARAAISRIFPDITIDATNPKDHFEAVRQDHGSHMPVFGIYDP
ncbi:MAG TPA: hypothetical protein VK817_16480 [Trebonia sp.]|jgi:hypothetical protein|nr:hypothetical protein [Trebonia sp.]